MKKVLEWFGDKRATSISAHEIEARFQSEKWSPATWNRYRALMSLVFRLAARNGKVSDNPVRLVPHKAEHNERVRFLSPAEEKKIRKAIIEKHPHRLAEFELALHTGLRLSEQYGARWADLDWNQRVLTIPRDKGGRTTHVPLNDAAFVALTALRRRHSSTEFVCGGVSGPRGWFEEVLTTAKVEGISWHCLRHTFASRLVMSGADVRTVAELLRDRTLKMVMRYAHLAPDYRMNAVQRMHEAFNAPKGVRTDRKSGTRSGTRGSSDVSVVH
jgi:integrase